MAIYRAADLSYQTWQQASVLLQPLTEKLPVTTTISIIAFTILGFQYFAINLYSLAVGTLISGLSYALMNSSYQNQNQESFFSICKKSVLQTRQYIEDLSNKPSLKSPMAPVVGTVSFAIFSYFAFSFIYRVSMGAICLGISSALLKGAASQKEKGLITFFGKNVASILDSGIFIKGPPAPPPSSSDLSNQLDSAFDALRQDQSYSSSTLRQEDVD